jgi:hypothetical protein
VGDSAAVPTISEVDTRQRYLLLWFYGAAAAFSVLLFLSNRQSVRILTFAVGVFGLWIFYRLLNLADERQKRINHQALRFAFLATLVLSLLAGFVRGFSAPLVSCVGLLAAMLIAWSIGLILFSWRYR